MSADETTSTEKKGKAGDEQFKFLIACIRNGVNGKIDWEEVAKECSIVSKGAAAKRYERLMKAHDISPQAAREASTATPKLQTGKAKETKTTPKKRKAADSDATEDAEAPNSETTAAATKKKSKKTPKSEKAVIKAEEDKEETSGGRFPPQLDGPADVVFYSDHVRPGVALIGRHINYVLSGIKTLLSAGKSAQFQRGTPKDSIRYEKHVSIHC